MDRLLLVFLQIYGSSFDVAVYLSLIGEVCCSFLFLQFRPVCGIQRSICSKYIFNARIIEALFTACCVLDPALVAQ